MNKRCTIAICRATINEGPVIAREANSAVTVVPMFAPTVTGKTWRRWIKPAPANGTKTEEVIELDWTDMVTSAPSVIAVMLPVIPGDKSLSMFFSRLVVT